MPRNHIHKRSDGRYTYKTSDATGKRHSIVSRKDEKYSYFKDRCDELDNLAEGQISSESVNDLFYFWLDNYVKTNNSKSDYDNSEYLYELHVMPFIGHKKIHEVTRADVYNVLNKAKIKGLATSTIKKIRGTMSRPYNWAINSLGYKLTAPTQGLVFKYPEDKNKITFLTDQDLERFFKAVENSKYYNYFKILLLTGLRPSEALGLKTKNIKKDFLEIRQGWTKDGLSNLKTSKAKRDFPMFDELHRYLSLQRTESMEMGTEWLFSTGNWRAVNERFKTSFKAHSKTDR